MAVESENLVDFVALKEIKQYLKSSPICLLLLLARMAKLGMGQYETESQTVVQIENNVSCLERPLEKSQLSGLFDLQEWQISSVHPAIDYWVSLEHLESEGWLNEYSKSQTLISQIAGNKPFYGHSNSPLTLVFTLCSEQTP